MRTGINHRTVEEEVIPHCTVILGQMVMVGPTTLKLMNEFFFRPAVYIGVTVRVD